MPYAIEHAETSKFLKPMRPRVCEACGHVHENYTRKKWTSELDEAELFDDKEEAEKKAYSIFLSGATGPRRKPRVVKIQI